MKRNFIEWLKQELKNEDSLFEDLKLAFLLMETKTTKIKNRKQSHHPQLDKKANHRMRMMNTKNMKIAMNMNTKKMERKMTDLIMFPKKRVNLILKLRVLRIQIQVKQMMRILASQILSVC